MTQVIMNLALCKQYKSKANWWWPFSLLCPQQEVVPPVQKGCTASPAPPDVWPQGWPQSTISRSWERCQETGRHTRRLDGSLEARQRISTPHLLLYARRKRRSTAQAMQNDPQQATGVHASDQTVKNFSALCSSVGICERTAELAGPPLAPIVSTDGSVFTHEHAWQPWVSLERAWWMLRFF